MEILAIVSKIYMHGRSVYKVTLNQVNIYVISKIMKYMIYLLGPGPVRGLFLPKPKTAPKAPKLG